MNDQQQPPAAAAKLRTMIDGFRLSQAIGTAVQVGVPDALAGGARSCDDIAAATGTHAATLYRLLRTLSANGILHEGDGKTFSLTDTGAMLTSNHPSSMASWAKLISRPYFWNAWGNLAHSVRTGETAFSALNGTDVWSYRAAHSAESAIFDAAMSEITRAMTAAALAAHDFSRYGVIVDIGGGRGTFLASILAAAPGSRGIVFDLPHVAENAHAALAAAGVADRCDSVGGDMFDAVPAGADAYLMKMILHDWEDPACIDILRVCRAAMAPGARVLVFESIIGPPNESPAEKMMDLNMLVMPGGRERTVEEFDALLGAAGLRLVGVTRTTSPVAIIEAAAAG